MTRACLFATVLCGGCLIVPATKTTRQQIETTRGAATFVQAREVTLEAGLDERTVRVRAKRIGECTRPVIAVIDVTTRKRARLGGAEDPRARAFGMLVAPVTIPLSLLVTGMIVAADRPETSRETRPIGTERFACSLEADRLAISLTLPSGAVVRRSTGRDGIVELDIPDGEPYEGTIAIAAPSAPTTQLAYKVAKPAITSARDAVLTCGAEHGFAGSVMLKLSINSTGRVTRVWLSAGDARFNACIGQQLAHVRFPDATRSGTLTLPLVVPAAAASL